MQEKLRSLKHINDNNKTDIVKDLKQERVTIIVIKASKQKFPNQKFE